MRVGLVLCGDLETVSGGYLYDRQLVEHLRRRGDEVAVVSLGQRRYGEGLLHNLSRRLAGDIAGMDVDLLLEDELAHPSLALLNRRLQARIRCPIVGVVHHLRCAEDHPPILRRLYEAVERSYLRSVDGLLCSSEATRREVQEVCRCRRPSEVAHPAGDRFRDLPEELEIAERARREGPMEVVFLGNLIPRKGLHVLLDAVARLPAGSVHLSVCGSPEADRRYAEMMRRRVGELSIDERVSFRGGIADEDLAALLRRSHVLAVPSHLEGFGIVYLEGMGFGLPAIASAGGGARELVTDGVDGFLVGGENAAAAVSARLEHLARDRARLAEMGSAARRRYRRHPSWETTMKRARRFLVEMAGGEQ
ncbi:MAG: glycosyltransferase family 4 protein [Spirochaetaceae bacterium]